MCIRLEETMMMGIKQIAWIINRQHFVPGTLRRKWLLLTQSTSHLFYGKLLKWIFGIKLLVQKGKHGNNECHNPAITEQGFQSENRGLLLTHRHRGKVVAHLLPHATKISMICAVGPMGWSFGEIQWFNGPINCKMLHGNPGQIFHFESKLAVFQGQFSFYNWESSKKKNNGYQFRFLQKCYFSDFD